ncbi:unnamed protein product, partial [Musa acuminata subsp. burmannicoides]
EEVSQFTAIGTWWRQGFSACHRRHGRHRELDLLHSTLTKLLNKKRFLLVL